MKTAIVRNRIKQYIHEFEESVDRLMTVQEFIDRIPEYYNLLKVDEAQPLGQITYDEFIKASQLGYQIGGRKAQERAIFDEMSKAGGL